MLKIRLVYTFCIYFCNFTCYFFNFRVSKIEKRFILILRTTTMQYKTEKDIIKSIKEFEKKTNNKKTIITFYNPKSLSNITKITIKI